MSIADAIRQALIKAENKRDIADIAKAVGMHHINLRQFRGGKRALPLTTLDKLAAELGLEIVTRPVRKNR